MKTILVTGIGGLTPRSITGIIRENHPDYKIIGCDLEKKAMGFFMKGLVDEYYICPRCDAPEYFPWIEKLVKDDMKVNELFDTELSLICDQRYDESDMQRIIEIINNSINH